ncbi:glycerophosphoryl diester phosphodiesterase [Oceanobacillus limi]|uniref:Glycerophosphoryl diester phosphodiesterase n=1 Tax=Oceanobacillus limi TaxID=930131 RepID=A0A1I0A408_9BACI|nr:glycerophosphoryl diester phosphodiesterase [Oceanobacillus limi]
MMLLGCQPKEAEVFHQTTEHDEQRESNNSSKTTSLLSPNRILNIAHRGASAYAPEHTLLSYQIGEELAADYIEIDLQMTKDNILVAMHDGDVSRTTDHEGTVKNMLLEEVKVLDAGSWFNEQYPDLAEPAFRSIEIPTLEEIFQEFGTEANYYIETKTPEQYPNMVEELVATLQEYHLTGEGVEEGKVIIQSFSAESLLEVHQLDPSIPLVQLIHYSGKAQISNKELKELKRYAVGLGVNHTTLTKDYVKKVRNAGLLLHPFTVNDTEDMVRLLDWGVTGMFTDYPDRLEEVLEERE